MLSMAMLLAAGVNAGEVPAANVIAPAAEKGVPARWGSAESVQAKISLKREQNAQQIIRLSFKTGIYPVALSSPLVSRSPVRHKQTWLGPSQRYLLPRQQYRLHNQWR